MRETIAVEGDLSIEVNDAPCEDYLELLRTVEFGSDALRYRRLDVQNHVQRLGNSFFFVIRRGESAAGIFALTPCELRFDNRSIQGVYRSQLCVTAAERRRGVGRLLRKAAIDWIRQKLTGTPFISWGCVDETNAQVLALLASQGALKLGTLCSYLCYRQWPQSSPAVVPSMQSPPPSMGPGLTLQTPGRSNRMIAENSVTASVDRVAINLRDYGRAPELLYRYLLRFIGPARRRFDPSCFQYARLFDLQFLDDEQHGLDTLIRHSMAMVGTHYAVVVRDPSSVNEDTRRAFGRFVQTTRLAVMAENFGVAPELISRMKNHTLHLEPMDI